MSEFVIFDDKDMCLSCAIANATYQVLYDAIEGSEGNFSSEDAEIIMKSIALLAPGHPMLAPYMRLLHFLNLQCSHSDEIPIETIELSVWKGIKGVSLSEALETFQEAGLIHIHSRYDENSEEFVTIIECTQELRDDLEAGGERSVGKLLAAIYKTRNFDIRDFTILIRALMDIIDDSGNIFPAYLYRELAGYRCRLCGDSSMIYGLHEKKLLLEHLKSDHNIENPDRLFNELVEIVEDVRPILPIRVIFEAARKIRPKRSSNLRFIYEKLDLMKILKPKDKTRPKFYDKEHGGRMVYYVADPWIKFAYRLKERLRERVRGRWEIG